MNILSFCFGRYGCKGTTFIFLQYPTFEGGFFHIFKGKINAELEFLYIVPEHKQIYYSIGVYNFE